MVSRGATRNQEGACGVQKKGQKQRARRFGGAIELGESVQCLGSGSSWRNGQQWGREGSMSSPIWGWNRMGLGLARPGRDTGLL